MRLGWAQAHPGSDDADLDGFRCWNGDPDVPWVQEVENYVRRHVLHDVPYVLAGRSGRDNLEAVAGFDRRVIAVPLADPVDQPGWHLQVIAIELASQGKGLFDETMRATFDIMRAVDPGRVLVTAHVHRENEASLKACARWELDVFQPLDEHYWVLLGEVTEA